MSKEESLEAKIKKPWAAFRSERYQAIFRLRSKLVFLFREYFLRNDYTELVSPKLVSSGLEIDISAFDVGFYDKEVYLSRGPQIYKTIMLSGGFDKVFEIGPIFRREREYTADHVAEFTAIDMDFAHVTSVDQVMDEFESIFRYVFTALPCLAEKEIGVLEAQVSDPGPFPRISIEEVYKILEKASIAKKEGDDLTKEDERIVGEWAREEHRSDFVMIYHYPFKDRFFYYMRDEDEPLYSHSFDVLYRGREVATCARKEHRKERIVEQARKMGANLEKLEGYLSIFDYGMPPYGGGGIGLDRLLQKMIGAENIREVIMFPRDYKNLTP